MSRGIVGSPYPTVPPRLLVVTTVYNMISDFLLPFAAHYRGRGWRVDALARPDDTFAECAPAFDRAWEIGWSRRPLEMRDVAGQLRLLRAIVSSGTLRPRARAHAHRGPDDPRCPARSPGRGHAQGPLHRPRPSFPVHGVATEKHGIPRCREARRSLDGLPRRYQRGGRGRRPTPRPCAGRPADTDARDRDRHRPLQPRPRISAERSPVSAVSYGSTLTTNFC